MKYMNIILFGLILMSCLSNKSVEQQSTKWQHALRSGQAIIIEDQTFDEVVDFIDLLPKQLIGNNIYQVVIPAAITFKHCTFNKAVIGYKSSDNSIIVASFMQNVSFLDCDFKAEFNLRASTVYGRFDISNSRFFDVVHLEELHCMGQSFATDCLFDKVANFQNSSFNRSVNFLNCQFNEQMSFQNANFTGEAQFGNCKFFKYADFSLINSNHQMFFNFSVFDDRAVFSNAHFNRTVSFASSQHKSTRFNKSKFFGKLILDESAFSNQLSLKDCFFLMEQPSLDKVEAKHIE